MAEISPCYHELELHKLNLGKLHARAAFDSFRVETSHNELNVFFKYQKGDDVEIFCINVEVACKDLKIADIVRPQISRNLGDIYSQVNLEVSLDFDLLKEWTRQCFDRQLNMRVEEETGGGI